MNETATFAAGCFWGVEELFRHEKGVKDTVVGYTGGHFLNPTYKDVCNNKTGHAEAVQVTYDPKEISYEKLLKIFWENHDPTTSNRQGPDVGSQYRSAVFYHTEEQEQAAKKSKEELEKSGKYSPKGGSASGGKSAIATEIISASAFYPAEEYHQQYLEKTGGVCRLNESVVKHHG